MNRNDKQRMPVSAEKIDRQIMVTTLELMKMQPTVLEVISASAKEDLRAHYALAQSASLNDVMILKAAMFLLAHLLVDGIDLAVGESDDVPNNRLAEMGKSLQKHLDSDDAALLQRAAAVAALTMSRDCARALMTLNTLAKIDTKLGTEGMILKKGTT